MAIVLENDLDLRRQELEQQFALKHQDTQHLGWAPRRRRKVGYYLPSDYYELLVSKCVNEETAWLDVGGGSTPFPTNRRLAEELSRRAHLLVGVDPSANLDDNPYVHERWKGMLEDYQTDRLFDLATLRMVAEHVENPVSFVRALHRLLRPGGKVIVFTVNEWSPVTVVSRVVPFRFHYQIKRIFWKGEEEDTFPTCYRMNTRLKLASLFENQGFQERRFWRLDDLSVFGGFKTLNHVEILAWRCLRAVGLCYPENCLLAIYEKRSG